MKSKTLKVHNLPQGRFTLLKMNIKPIRFLIILLIGSLALLALHDPFPTIGMIIVVVVFFALVAMPDRTLFEMNNEFITIYDPKNDRECTIVYWDEIYNWQYVKNKQCDYLVFELSDNQIITTEVYRNMKLFKLLHEFAPKKEKKVTRRKRI